MAPTSLLRKARVVGPRLLTSRSRALPDFIVIGAMRSGSTSLHQWITDQPGVVAASGKELHYFDLRYRRGPAWYRSQFPRRSQLAAGGSRRITGEATPYYLFHPDVPRRVRALVPDVRLVAVLRDPVVRAHSHYQHEVAKGRETLPYEAALDAEEARLAGEAERLVADERSTSPAHQHFSYAARGRYGEQLERWLEWFPREQLHVICTEDVIAAPGPPLGELADFLGLRGADASTFPMRNVRPYDPAPTDVQARLRARFADDSARLAALLGRPLPWPT